MAMAVEESLIGPARPTTAPGAGSSTGPSAAATAKARPSSIASWRTRTIFCNGSKAASPANQAMVSAGYIMPADDDAELIRRDAAPVALTTGLRLNPDRSINEAWCRRCDLRFSLVQMQVQDRRGCCQRCQQRVEIVTVNTTWRSGAWMSADGGHIVWPTTWVDMWADRSTQVHNALVAPNAIVEGDVIQSQIYVSLVGRFFHFDPCCPGLTDGVDENWYLVNQHLDPAVPNGLGPINVGSGRGLRPCNRCAARFIRPPRSGR